MVSGIEEFYHEPHEQTRTNKESMPTVPVTTPLDSKLKITGP